MFIFIFFAQTSDRLVSIELSQCNRFDRLAVLRSFHRIRSGECSASAAKVIVSTESIAKLISDYSVANDKIRKVRTFMSEFELTGSCELYRIQQFDI